MDFAPAALSWVTAPVALKPVASIGSTRMTSAVGRWLGALK